MTDPARPTSHSASQGKPTRKCPVCGAPRDEAHKPFCSTRCRDRDLLQWLSDGYALPGTGQDEPDDEEVFNR
ncbi:MAG TPA: DNA gyrase inhibitor YacG [Novosphingobium sp.]|nr:DNA gyrase inhibitor YacG [Novosphingobium sp.]